MDSACICFVSTMGAARFFSFGCFCATAAALSSSDVGVDDDRSPSERRGESILDSEFDEEW